MQMDLGKKQKVYVSIPAEVLEAVDDFKIKKCFKNRSEALFHLLSVGLNQEILAERWKPEGK